MDNLIGKGCYYSPVCGEIEPKPATIVSVRHLENQAGHMTQAELDDGRWVNVGKLYFERNNPNRELNPKKLYFNPDDASPEA